MMESIQKYLDTTELEWPTDNTIHVHTDICSISITRTDEGVSVAVWEKGFEGAEAVASTYAFNQELGQ